MPTRFTLQPRPPTQWPPSFMRHPLLTMARPVMLTAMVLLLLLQIDHNGMPLSSGSNTCSCGEDRGVSVRGHPLGVWRMVRLVVQPAAAQWSYSGPSVGCTGVLDAYTNGVRNRSASAYIMVFTVRNVPRFHLYGPDCTIRGAFSISFDIQAMRALAVGANASNVSIAIGPGVHFEGLLDAAVFNTWSLRLPNVMVQFAPNVASAFDPDALPVDFWMGGGVTWTAQDLAINASMMNELSWYLVALRNGQHIPRGSRIAVTDTAFSMDRCSITNVGSSSVSLVVSVLHAPNANPLTLLDRTQILVQNTTATLRDTQVGKVSFNLRLVYCYINSPLTLYNGAMLHLNGNTVSAVNSSTGGTSLGLDLLSTYHFSPIALYNTSQIRLTDNTVTATNCSISSGNLLLSLFYLTNTCPLTLFDASTVVIGGTTATKALNSSSGTGGLSLSCFYASNNSPIVLYNASQLSVGGGGSGDGNTYQTAGSAPPPPNASTPVIVTAVDCRGGTMSLSILYINSGGSLSLYGASQLVIGGGISSGGGTNSTTTPKSATDVLVVSVLGGTVGSSLYITLVYVIGSSPIALYNTSLLRVRNATVTRLGGSSGGSGNVYLFLVYASITSPLTLHDAARLVVNTSVVAAVGIQRGGNFNLALIYCQSNSALTLHNASRLTIGSQSNVTVVDSDTTTAMNIFLIVGVTNSPLRVSNAALMTMSSSTVAMVGSSAASVVVGAVVFESVLCTLADDARIALDGLAVRADGVTSSANAMQMLVLGLTAGAAAVLDMSDRSAVLITRCSATVTHTTSRLALPQPIASIFNVRTTTLRSNSTVWLCASTTAVTNATIGGIYYQNAFTSPAAVGPAFGAVDAVGGCNATGLQGSGCGLFVSDTMNDCLVRGPAANTHTPSTTPTASSLLTWTRTNPRTTTAAGTLTKTIGHTPTLPKTQTRSLLQTASKILTLTKTQNSKTVMTTATQRIPGPPSPTPLPPPVIPADAATAVVAVTGTIAATVAADLQAQTALTLSRCAAEAAGGAIRASDRSFRALSPFATADSCGGLLQGHAILFGTAVLVMGVAVVAVVAWRRFRGESTRPLHVVLSAARCPSLLLAVGVFMLTGLVVCGGRGDGAAQQALSLTIAALLSAAGPVLAALLGTRRYVDYAGPPVPEMFSGSAVACAVASVLLPRGELRVPSNSNDRHVPAEWSKLLAAAVGAWRFPSPLLAFVPQLSALALVPAMLASGALCGPLHWVSAGLFWACVLLIAAVRPRRILVADVLHCAALAVNGALVAAAAADARGGPFAESLAAVQTALTVVRVAHVVLLALLPRVSAVWRVALETAGDGYVIRSSSSNSGGDDTWRPSGEWLFVGWWHRCPHPSSSRTRRDARGWADALSVPLTDLHLEDDAALLPTDINDNGNTRRREAPPLPTIAQENDAGALANVSPPLAASAKKRISKRGNFAVPPPVPSPTISNAVVVLPTPPLQCVKDASHPLHPSPPALWRVVYTSRDLQQRPMDVVATLGARDPHLMADVALERADCEARRRGLPLIGVRTPSR